MSAATYMPSIDVNTIIYNGPLANTSQLSRDAVRQKQVAIIEHWKVHFAKDKVLVVPKNVQLDRAAFESVEPLTYQAFCAIVAEVVKSEAPNVKVVTDRNQNRFIVWLSCNGIEFENTVLANSDDAEVRAVVSYLLDGIKEELGKRAVDAPR